jgi:hypothetical protein
VKVAYCTAGTVGAGHAVRGMAIGRGLARAGFAGEYRMFGPALPFPAVRRLPGYEVVPIASDQALHDRHLAPTTELAARLRRYDPDLLLVDMFWMPLRHVLPALRCECWLLVRICPPVWLTGPPAAPFQPEQYSRILGIEPSTHPRVDAVVDPIVVCNRDECRPPAALRELFRVPAGQPLRVALHAGERGEVEMLARAGAGQPLTVLDLFDEQAPFPAAEWLGGADQIVSGAGYNAYWEARWLGYAERTIFVPFPRSIDDQSRRLEQFATHGMAANGADVLARWILDRG